MELQNGKANRKWYETIFRRAIMDMHIADWDESFMSKFDPETFAEAMQTAQVREVLLVAINCLGITYWPTKAGHMHRGVKGRDVFGETLKALHDRDIKVCGYYNIWSRWAYDNHEDWRVRKPDGQGVMVDWGERFGLCCYNTPFADYVYAQVRELSAGYDLDGFWNDMIGDFGFPCYCDSCKERFKKETGNELPEIIDWNDPVWILLCQKRREWLAAFTQNITDIVKSEKPEIPVAHQTTDYLFEWKGSASAEFFAASDYLSGDFPPGAIEQAVMCKFLRSCSPVKPIDFMTSRCADLLDHTTQKSDMELKAQIYSAIANNAAFSFIDAVDVEGTVNMAFYKKMGRLYEELKRFEPYIEPYAEPCCDVAVMMSFSSLMNLDDNGAEVNTHEYKSHQVKGAQEIAKALLDGNIPFNMISELNLPELSRYQILVMSEQYIVTEETARAVRAFVENGGSLYVSGKCGLLSDRGMLDNFSIADILGVDFEEITKENITYVKPAAAARELFGEFEYTAQYPMLLHQNQVTVKPRSGVEVLATAALPRTPPRDSMIYSSAISDPPGDDTGKPVVTLRRLGKGKVVYCGGRPETEVYYAQKGVFRNLLKLLEHRPREFYTNAYHSVEVTKFDVKDKNRFVVNFLNFQEQGGCPACHMEIRVNMNGKKPVNVTLAPDREPVEFASEDGFVSFKVPRVDIYSMFMIEYENGMGFND